MFTGLNLWHFGELDCDASLHTSPTNYAIGFGPFHFTASLWVSWLYFIPLFSESHMCSC